MNWRGGFADHVQAHVDQINLWASRHEGPTFKVDGVNIFPYQMDEDEIREAARYEAAKDMDRAIIEWNNSAARREQR